MSSRVKYVAPGCSLLILGKKDPQQLLVGFTKAAMCEDNQEFELFVVATINCINDCRNCFLPTSVVRAYWRVFRFALHKG